MKNITPARCFEEKDGNTLTLLFPVPKDSQPSLLSVGLPRSYIDKRKTMGSRPLKSKLGHLLLAGPSSVLLLLVKSEMLVQ